MTISEVARSHPKVRYEVLRGDIKAASDHFFVESVLGLISSRGAMKEISPLPVHAFSLERESSDAFLFLRHANHIGKVVIYLKHHGLDRGYAKACCVTNGLDPLGNLITHWLVQQSTKCITLLSHNQPTKHKSFVVSSSKEHSLQIGLCDVIQDRQAMSCLEMGGSVLDAIMHVNGK